MPEWIAVRTPGDEHVVTSRAPFSPETTDALVRAARSVRSDSPTPSVESHHSIYVVLLELADGEYGLYVGLTGLTRKSAT